MTMEKNFLYKYKNFGEYTDKIIKNASLYLSPIEEFNDPFDSNLAYRQYYTKEEIKKYWKKLSKEINLSSLEYALKKYVKNETFVKLQNENRYKADRKSVV